MTVVETYRDRHTTNIDEIRYNILSLFRHMGHEWKNEFKKKTKLCFALF